ncbi:MAG: diguanylate cyclase, partial [Gammaproteobacteria bacterium]|nr:diguanylate cyclase [Gammaproteobacteria bacterium]
MEHHLTLTGLQDAVGDRTVGGLDVVYTKLAVDLQNLAGGAADPVLSAALETLREATACDAVAVALLDPAGSSVQQVLAARSTFAICNPEVLTGVSLEQLPWLDKHLDHLRVHGIASTDMATTAESVDAARLAAMACGALLLIGFHIHGQRAGFLGLFFGQPQKVWSVDHTLLLKLLGSSLASGLERVRTTGRLAEINEREHLLELTVNDGTWDFDAKNNRVEYSPRWKRMMGYDDADLARNAPDWRRIVHVDDYARLQARLRDHLAGRTEIFENTHRMRRKDGEWRWMTCRAKALLDDHGRLRRLVGVETDITEQKIYEEALFREKESAQITLQSIGDGVVTTDHEGIVEYINPVAEELTGWNVDDAGGRHVDDIFRGFHEETCEPLENPVMSSIKRNRAVKSVRPSLLIRRDGNELYIESTASPIRNDRGDVTGGVLVFHDVSESRELNRRLSYHASHDLLTGLVNRREFESRLERSLKSAKARETSYALLYLDLDQFKIINDSCGHGAGDMLLTQLGALLKAKIRWRDTLARLGGDEFGLLLEACSTEEAMRTAEMLREAIKDYKFSWDDRTFRLSASVGVVPITGDDDNVATLITAGDSACQAAKEAGRNRIHTFKQNDIDLMRRRREMQWAARINNALEDDRFELYRMTIQPLQVEETGS